MDYFYFYNMQIKGLSRIPKKVFSQLWTDQWVGWRLSVNSQVCGCGGVVGYLQR